MTACGGSWPARACPTGAINDATPFPADVLSGHVVFELECIDRVYCNLYVPKLQRDLGGVRQVNGVTLFCVLLPLWVFNACCRLACCGPDRGARLDRGREVVALSGGGPDLDPLRLLGRWWPPARGPLSSRASPALRTPFIVMPALR